MKKILLLVTIVAGQMQAMQDKFKLEPGKIVKLDKPGTYYIGPKGQIEKYALTRTAQNYKDYKDAQFPKENLDNNKAVNNDPLYSRKTIQKPRGLMNREGKIIDRDGFVIPLTAAQVRQNESYPSIVRRHHNPNEAWQRLETQLDVELPLLPQYLEGVELPKAKKAPLPPRSRQGYRWLLGLSNGSEKK